MVTLKVGVRVRFSSRADASIVSDATSSSSIRPGELWEGVIMTISWDVDGRQLVTVRVDSLNGMRTVGLKEVYADAVSWEVP